MPSLSERLAEKARQQREAAAAPVVEFPAPVAPSPVESISPLETDSLSDSRVPNPDSLSDSDSPVKSSRPAESDRLSKSDTMRSKEKYDERTPAAVAPAIDVRASTLQTLRAIALSYRHSTPDVDDEDVGTRLRQWFETEGQEIDEAMIDEAVRETV